MREREVRVGGKREQDGKIRRKKEREKICEKSG